MASGSDPTLQEARSDTEGQEQMRFRSPWTASMRETVGQYLEVRVQGAGKAGGVVKEDGRSEMEDGGMSWRVAGYGWRVILNAEGMSPLQG